MEIRGAETDKPEGLVVGVPGGGMYAPDEAFVEDGQLTFVFNRRYGVPGEQASGRNRPERRGLYTARIENGRLVGYHEVEGFPATRLDYTGIRAPEITETDDGAWKEGEPVELFNGKDLSGWIPVEKNKELGWEVIGGLLTNTPGANNLDSEQSFWNFKIHAEYRLGEHSNSGIGLRGRYEVQVFEDYGKPPDKQGHGAVYYRITPTENASLPPGEWQTMDITLIGRMVTVVLNGKTIIDKQIIEGPTAIGHDPYEDKPGPIFIQGDHGKVEFRKLTVTPLTR